MIKRICDFLNAAANRSVSGLFTAVVLSLTLVTGAGATTLYVGKTGCSDTGSGSQQTPYCKIGVAASKAAPGDTVLVSAGSYNEQVTLVNSGTQGSPIVIQAKDGDLVTVYGMENGFRAFNVSWVTIKGFTITDTVKYGIYTRYSNNLVIANNHVTKAGLPVVNKNYFGIRVESSTDCLVSGNLVDYNTDSGIYIVSGSTRVTVDGNTFSYNAQQFARAAPGIEVRSAGNTVKNNISHHNEDSGIQIRGYGTDTLVVNNLIYSNGDHGIDISGVAGQILLNNTVYGSLTSGINIELASPNCILANNITVDNGINSPRKVGNININTDSSVGTVLDYDLLWLSQAAVQIVWKDVNYSSLADFVAASKMEKNGVAANPLWVDLSKEDFHLTGGSPAIDSANSGANGGVQTTDIESKPRVDIQDVANTGGGSLAYFDRGAYEYQAVTGPDKIPPTVAITYPANGQNVSGIITVTATASDNVGVAGVQFQLNGSDLGTEILSSPYSLMWDTSTVTDGSYAVKALATDTSQNVGESAFVAITVNNSSPQPTVHTLTAIADAGLYSAYPSTNYGSATTLDTDRTPLTRFLIKFDVTGITGNITAAKLRLYCRNGSDIGGIVYRFLDTSWLESNVTWANATGATTTPPSGIAIGSQGAVVKSTWVEFNLDVINLFSNASSNSLYSILVWTSSGDGAEYNSRERVGYEPQLVLTVQ